MTAMSQNQLIFFREFVNTLHLRKKVLGCKAALHGRNETDLRYHGCYFILKGKFCSYDKLNSLFALRKSFP